jgi:integrase/recombinase XerD
MIEEVMGRFPLVAGDEYARRWLTFIANIGRAPNTVEAYGRAVNEHLAFCAANGAAPAMAGLEVVGAWVGELSSRPSLRSVKLVHLDSGVGLSNATIQQRIVAVRSFYQFLVEEGVRERNPVRRGEAARRGRGRARRGLVRPVERMPWLPNEDLWRAVLDAAQAEPLRNRLMIALAYDGALRREALVRLHVDDFEPAYSLIHLRAETTKSKRAREVAYGAAAGQLFAQYLAERRQRFGRRGGQLLLSTSRRNPGAPISLWSWSKIVQRLSARSQVVQLSTHTFRHLRLTDLARAEWTIDQIAQYAGHRDLSVTMKYIHLSGRELAERFTRSMNSIHAAREALLAGLVRP